MAGRGRRPAPADGRGARSMRRSPAALRPARGTFSAGQPGAARFRRDLLPAPGPARV